MERYNQLKSIFFISTQQIHLCLLQVSMGVVHPRSEPEPNHRPSAVCRWTDANHLDLPGAPFDPLDIAGRPMHVYHCVLAATCTALQVRLLLVLHNVHTLYS